MFEGNLGISIINLLIYKTEYMYILPKTSVTMRTSSYCHYGIQIDF